MKRVAALWLPNWSIDRVVRAEPTLAPPPERGHTRYDLAPLRAAVAAEQVLQCDAPRNSGWRPGARWARGDQDLTRQDIAQQIAALPAHRRPPMRMLGRSSEAADHPFKAPFKPMPADEGSALTARELARWGETAPPLRRLPGDDGGAPALGRWQVVPSVRYPGDGPHPDKHAQKSMRRGSNDPHSAPPGIAAFFDTGRTMAGLVGQVCRAEPESPAPESPAVPAAGLVLVTTHKVGARVEVAAASPAARALGIEPGMALTQVRASVPQVVVRDADPAGDAADLHTLAILLARRWAPSVAPSDPDGLFVDLSGVAHLHGGEARFAARLVRLLARAGVTARVAVADTTGAAWALARHGGDKGGGAAVTLCPPGRHAAALDPLPAAALRLDAPVLALFRRLGVETVADVRALPRAPFARRFGTAAARRLDQALGTAAEPLDPVVPPATIRVSQRFAEPLASAEAIAHWLGRLTPRLTAALAEAGQGARVLLCIADRVDGVPQVIRIGFARPNRDPAHLLRLIVRRIEEIDPGFGIDTLHLHVRRVEPLGARPFDQTLEARVPDLGPLVDTLANRGAVTWRQAPVASDVPERSVAARAPLDPPARDAPLLKRDDVRRLDTRAGPDPWQPCWPRPIRLLRRPELLDHVMAELPDRPPVRFTWRGVRHVVVRADGPERIAGEWWRRASERDAVRDYFRVEDEAGRRFWLFRRGDGERSATGAMDWYLHGRFG